MASFIYNSCLWDAFRKKIDFDNDQFVVVLLSDEYNPDKNNHSRRSDLDGEVSGKGYLTGGMAVDVRATMSDEKLTLALGGLTMPEATVTARYAVYCVANGDAGDDPLIACIDFGGPVSSTNGDFALSQSSLRIMN